MGAVGVGVELQQPFGQLAVVESRSGDDGGYYVFVAAIGGKQVYACSVETGAERVEFGEEGEVVDAVYDFGRVGAGLRRSVGSVEVGEEGFEHSRCGSRCRDKLACFAAVGKVSVPPVCGGTALVVGEPGYAVAHGCGSEQAQVWKSGFKSVELFAGVGFRYAFGLECL